MKLFALLSLIGFASAVSVLTPVTRPDSLEWRWTPGKTYVYDYQSRMLTGLPELATHYSGLGIRAKVYLDVKSNTDFVIRVEEPKYVRVSEELRPRQDQPGQGKQNKEQSIWGYETDNWRFLELPEFTPVPQEFVQYLRKPTEVRFNQNGAFKEMDVYENAPEWVLNFKKAIVGIIQTQYREGSQSVEQNKVQRLSEGLNGEQESYWKVSEESIDGICDVTYQVNELPEYMVKDYPELTGSDNSRKESRCGDNSKYFELTKTKDVTSCTRRASFSFYKPGHFNCPTGNCDGMWSRSSITRFIGCSDESSSSFRNVKIQAIHNEGELHMDLFGMKTEKFLNGVRQVFKLVDQQEYSQQEQKQVEESDDGAKKPIYSLLYEMKHNQIFGGDKKSMLTGELRGEAEQLREEEREEHIQKHLQHVYESLPRNILTGRLQFEDNNGEDRSNGQDLIPEMQKLFNQLIKEDLYNTEKVAEKRVTMKVLNLARGFTLMKIDVIRSLYNQLKSEFSSEEFRPIFKNLFFDTLVMGGTTDNLVFLKEHITSGSEMTYVQKEYILMLLSKYVVFPNQKTMQILYEIVTSEQIRSESGVQHHAMLGYTVLVEKACIAENRDTSYPDFIYKNLCNPESQTVRQWIDYLQQLTRSNEAANRNLAIVALGLISHKSVVPMLLPFVERRSENESSELTRFLAIYSLANVGRRNPDAVEPIVYSIFSNPAEKTELRAAAFNVLLKLNPSMTTFHKIGALTWREKNVEILELINTALFTLSNMPESAAQQDVYQKPDQSSIQRKAQLIYPIIKKAGGNRFPATATIYNGDYLQELGVGFQSISSWSGSEDSVIPQNYYSRLTYFLNRYQFNIYEFGVRFNGVESVVEELVQVVSEGSQEQSGEEQSNEEHLIRNLESQLDSEWKQVIEQLKIKTRQGSDTEGVFFANFFENAPFFYNFQTQTKRMLRQKIRQLIKNPQEALSQQLKNGNNNNFNFQRALDLSPVEFFIPSDMGLPIVIEVHMPVVLSIRGNMNMRISLEKPTLNMSIKKLFAAQLTGWVGTVCPFTNEYIVTGIDEHYVHNIPSNIEINANLREQELRLAFKLVDEQQSSSPVDVFHFHVRPYTVHVQLRSLEPMTLSRNINWIKARDSGRQEGQGKQSLTQHWGKYLGLQLTSVITTESRYLDSRTVLEKLRLYNYNPINMLRFGWASTAISERQTASFRSHEYRLTFNPQDSETKEIELWAKIGVATVQKKNQESQETTKKYQSLKVAEFNSIRGQQGQQQTPVEIESSPLGESQKHQKRQQHLEKALKKIEGVEEGTGVVILYTAYLRNQQGQIRRHWSYNLTIAAGRTDYHNKWDLEIATDSNENQHQDQNQKICIRGQIQSPHFPIWKVNQIRSSAVEYRYENKISFGRNCQESEISVLGTARTSEKQKEQSRKSPAAKQFEKMLEKNVPMTELSQVADQVRREATTLDEIDYKVSFRNVDQRYINYKRTGVEFLKSYLWPYLVRSTTTGMNQQSQQGQQQQWGQRSSESDEFRFRFKPEASAFDLTIVSPQGPTKFENVRMPYWMNFVLPFSPYYPYKSGVAASIMQTITGSEKPFPVCQVEGEHLKTYKNETEDINNLDQCFHLLSADCSQQKRFSVLLRQTRKGSDSPREMKVILGDVNILLTPSDSHSKYNSQIRVFVNDQPLILSRKNVWVPIKKSSGDSKQIAQVRLTEDGVVQLKSYWVSVHFNGELSEVIASPWLKSKLCGICGNLDQSKPSVSGPEECVYSKSKLMVASYRTQLPQGKCSPMKPEIERELREEKSRCTKYEHIPTKVSGSYKYEAGQLMRHQHQIIEKHSEICISRHSVPECNQRVAKTEGVKEVEVSFVCLPKNRTSQRYAEKARQGDSLQELANLPETQKMRLPLPKACVPVNAEL